MSFVKIMITCVFVNASMYCADFDSLFINSFPVYETLSYQEKMRWQPLIKAYNEHIAQRPVYSVVARIPKIIHQIWLGGQLPERLKLMQQTVIDLHPDWEYRLWTDADIAEFGLINQDLFDACNNWGQKSDIARYEIIYRLGGVYIDSDIQCVKPLDDIHHICDFYAGADGGWLTENEVVVCNAFFWCSARASHFVGIIKYHYGHRK